MKRSDTVLGDKPGANVVPSAPVPRTCRRSHARGFLALTLLLPWATAQADVQPQIPTKEMSPAPAVATANPLGLEPHVFLYSRFERRENDGSTVADGSDYVRYRAMLSLSTTPFWINQSYQLQARFTPQVGGYWGLGLNKAEDPAVLMHEALVKLTMPGSVLEVGRFELSYGDELVIGPGRWGYPGRSFDAVRLHIQQDKESPWVDFFASQVFEVVQYSDQTYSENLGSGDLYLFGGYVGLGALLPGHAELDVYALGLLKPGLAQDSGTTLDNSMRFHAGSRLKGKLSLWDWRLEAGLQAGAENQGGTDVALSGIQLDADTGVTLPLLRGLRLGVEGFYASGDDPATLEVNEAYNPLYPTTHKWLGIMDYINVRSNIYGAAFQAKFDPFAFLTVKGDAHTFWQPFTTDADGVVTKDVYQGLELDGSVLYRIGTGINLQAAGGLFFREAAVVGTTDPDILTLRYAELELQTKF